MSGQNCRVYLSINQIIESWISMKQTLDDILALQILVAKAGETERLNWWRIDATDEAGGGDFFQRLVGSLSPMASTEAALKGAAAKELEIMQNASIDHEMVSLFHLPGELQIQVQERWGFYKKHPEQLPEALQQLIAHDWTFESSAFEATLAGIDKPSYERSPLGRKVRGSQPTDPIDLVKNLAAVLLPLDTTYPLPYYP